MKTNIFICLYFLNILLNSLIQYCSKAFTQELYWYSIKNEKQYFDSLFTADEITFQREFEYPFLFLLKEKQRNSYLGIDSLVERKLFIESYWKKMNPNPILPENDWLLAFINRCTYVKKFFSSAKPPFFDDRGKYYIKYGKPTDRYQDSGGRKTVRLFKNPGVYQYFSRLYNGFPPNMYYWTYPNESWVYRNMGQDFIIHFVKEGEDFHEVKSLTKAFSTGIAKNVAWYWNDLIQYRAHLTPSMTRIANNLLQLENEIIIAAQSGIKRSATRSKMLPHRKIFEQKAIFEAEVIMNKRNAPLFVHYPIQAINELNFFSDIVQYRGPDDSTKVDIVILSPLKKNILSDKFPSQLDTISVEFQCLIQDLKGAPMTRVKKKAKFPLNFFRVENFFNVVGHLVFNVLPQQGDLTLQIKEMNNGSIGFSRQVINIRDFSSKNLMISDIQFFKKITKANLQQVLPVMEKQNVMVAPYPYKKIRKSLPLFCYFEIYNLQSAGVTDEYEVELKVYTDKKSRGVFKKLIKWLIGAKDVSISIIHTRPVTNENVQEFMAIDFSNLANGKYRFEITVADKKNKNIVASVQKEIIIID